MINIITNNPFRVLGVFSNAKQTDIVRNVGKMKAYLNVGKGVSFTTDVDFLLGSIGRTMESVQKAQSDINLPKDKIRYALFWFCNGNSLDEVALNHLANQDIGKAIEILGKKTSYSSLVNMAVIATIQGRYNDAVSFYSQLVHNLANRNQFVTDVCGDTFQIYEDELMHIIIDELLTVAKPISLRNALTVSADISYISEKALSEPLSKINSEIAKAKSVSGTDAYASLRAGRELIRNTKSALANVKSLAGISSIQYQSTADSLAKQILQCGINYFNNTNDENNVETALEIQQYALSIAVGKLVKDRCKQNVDILLERNKQAAYEKDILYVAAELKSFQAVSPSMQRAEALVRNCKPHLDVIKSNLGSYDDSYLKISSAVANNALGMLIAIVNQAQNVYNISSGTLSNTIDSALKAMVLIGSLDMTTQTRSRYNQNHTTLENLQSQLAAAERLANTPPYGPPSPGSDDTNWGCIIPIIIAVIFIIGVLING